MKIVLTGSSGRVGRAIYNALASEHQIIGIDKIPFATTHLTSDFADLELLTQTMKGADAIIHTAALHAPHVGLVSDIEFQRVNVDGTRLVIEAAKRLGVRRIVFTSTTAVFGRRSDDNLCAWINEDTLPQPTSVYHRTKLEAEALLQQAANENFVVRVIRMSRSFPEQANVMAIYRLSRGIDVRDVADAHVAALTNAGPVYQTYIVSGKTPFQKEDCEQLACNLKSVLERRAPDVIKAFKQRGWMIPNSIDRVYTSSKTETYLNWSPRYGFEEVLSQLDERSLEVLPSNSKINQRKE